MKRGSLCIKESLSLLPVTIYLVSKQYHKVGTDEGVCPYFVVSIWLKRTIQTSFREALLPFGEAGRGFHSKASVPTLWHYIQPIQQLFYLFTHLLFYLFQFLLTRQLVNSSTYTNPDFEIKGTFPNYHPLAAPLLRRGWVELRTLQ